ncbi:MAG: hypothetical protein IT582_00325, partial [Opitutaceae bacterium]|nr:hypothetical protein [Opitutaceae bacterium]
MQETAFGFFNLEWPPTGATLAGPVLWLRGWAVGQNGVALTDVRARHGGATHLGIYGLPRADLAAHFNARQPWLPAEFIIGVPVADGPVRLNLDFMDELGAWHELPPVDFAVAPNGQPPPRVEGRLETSLDGTWTVRDAHHPLQGHLNPPDDPLVPRLGRIPVRGWLLDTASPLERVLATTDTVAFNHLEHSRKDEELARKFPQHPGALHARLQGWADCAAGLVNPVCLRVYAVSTDGAARLCFAQRLTLAPPPHEPASITPDSSAPPIRPLPDFPSGRPHRLLMFVRTLYPDDATLRALDLAAHLRATSRWAVRMVSTEDGPLRDAFFTVGAETLIV